MIGAAIKSQREEAAWTEGVAIWVAVAVVSIVGDPSIHLLALQGKGADWLRLLLVFSKKFGSLTFRKLPCEIHISSKRSSRRARVPHLANDL